jgi:hypothetical protein
MSILFVITPLPPSFFWSSILLPSFMTAFLAEGSKFLLFHTTMCRNTVWFSPERESLPHVAESCTLGSTSYCCMAASLAFLGSLLFVFRMAPVPRSLDSEYGIRSSTAPQHPPSSTPEASPANVMQTASGSFIRSGREDDRSDLQHSDDVEFPWISSSSTDSHSGHATASNRAEEEDLLSKRLKALDKRDDRYRSRTYSMYESQIDLEYGSDEGHRSLRRGERSNPTSNKKQAPAAEEEPARERISESRLYAAERLRVSAMNESRAMIEHFVKEVNQSFALTSKNKIRGGRKPEVNGKTNEENET